LPVRGEPTPLAGQGNHRLAHSAHSSMTSVSASASAAHESAPDFSRFAIGFDQRDRERLHALIDEILDSNRWSEADLVARFEAGWEAYHEAPAVACSSWAGGAMAAEECKPRAAILVHIGGHIAFDTARIAQYCAEQGIFLIEDCAHAHGASWNGRRAGTWGDAGVYSLYATKTISTGEGGVLISRRPEVIEHARSFRNYGKPTFEVAGLNFRMSEFTAALGLVQIERLAEIVAWKNETARTQLDGRYPSRLQLPEGMTSGLYKYIVFDWLERSTGRVYDEPCHRIMGHDVELPNSEWVARNHSCVPLYYRPEH
jgi:perosamine synthetase